MNLEPHVRYELFLLLGFRKKNKNLRMKKGETKIKERKNKAKR